MLVQYSLSPNPTPPSLPPAFCQTSLTVRPYPFILLTGMRHCENTAGDKRPTGWKHIMWSSTQWAQSEENKNSWRNRKPRQIVRGTHVNVTCVNVVRAFDAASRYQLHSCWFVCCKEKKRSIRAALNTGKYLLQLELFCDENVFFLSFFSLNPWCKAKRERLQTEKTNVGWKKRFFWRSLNCWGSCY